MSNYSATWSLDSAFTGGSSSPELASELQTLAEELPALLHRLKKIDPQDISLLTLCLNDLQITATRMVTCSAFIGCLTSADTEDRQALLLYGQTNLLWAGLNDILVLLAKKLSDVDPDSWSAFLAQPALADLRFNLEELRQKAKDLLPLEQEMIINALSVNGYAEWSTLYDRLVAGIYIPSEDSQGLISQLSAGQALNRLNDADAIVRNSLLKAWEFTWQDHSEIGALELNAQVGYRLTVYKLRGWDDFMKEPLQMNRMQAATLEAMWATITENKAKLVSYLQRKKALLGLSELSWADFNAPVILARDNHTYTLDEAAEFVIRQFGRLSPKMATYAAEAFAKKWIESENRPGKAIGAYCTGFPTIDEERVFMTFDGSSHGVGTLAHELGHAFHSRAMQGLPLLAREIGMAVAETGSTFAEIVVGNAALAQAEDELHRLRLLDEKINNAAAMMMNIHARFIFETNFYQARKQRQIPASELNEMMLAAQKEAYCDALDIWHPTFWLSKGHFHGHSVPFYNFPYTFGFLFANGIYASAEALAEEFEDRYIELLRNTGSMDVEDLAKHFLGADLTRSEFWQMAIDIALADIPEFLSLSARYTSDHP
ncbi:MAG: M3 family oligoendopeptidase [Symbiobacteriaceae bacterium]|nr:M3 family oligoendopeptidase [Symbiobacteriaceae bacterium]